MAELAERTWRIDAPPNGVALGETLDLSGPLAGFGEANTFILDAVNKLVADGLMLGDKSYKVEIVQKDVESNSDTAASRAGGARPSASCTARRCASPRCWPAWRRRRGPTT